MVLTTKVASAKAGTKSIKSTIPEGIVEFLQIQDKDELEWKMEFQKDERVVVVRKRGVFENTESMKRPKRFIK